MQTNTPAPIEVEVTTNGGNMFSNFYKGCKEFWRPVTKPIVELFTATTDKIGDMACELDSSDDGPDDIVPEDS